MSLKITRPTKNFDKPFTTDYSYQFQSFLQENGLEPDPKVGLVANGSIGRAYINVGGQRKLVGWYQLWLDQSVPFGRLGDYRISADQPTAIWKPENQKRMKVTKEQREEIKELQKQAEVKDTMYIKGQKNWFLSPDERELLQESNEIYRTQSSVEDLILEHVDFTTDYPKPVQMTKLLRDLGIKSPRMPDFKEAARVLHEKGIEARRTNGKKVYDISYTKVEDDGFTDYSSKFGDD